MIRKGTKVRMSTAFKKFMRKNSAAHVSEFGNCVGVVEGKVRYPSVDCAGKFKTFSEVDVRWKPSGLRYSYFPKDLVRVK